LATLPVKLVYELLVAAKFPLIPALITIKENLEKKDIFRDIFRYIY
jgi:hypothetical protein